MYNGIGLKTARGTGTNGYIQRNQSNLRPRDTPFDKQHAQVRHTQPDAGILEHERKRKIELQCMELQVELEDQDVADDVIEARVSELRTRLLQSNTPTQQQQKGKIGPGETHKLREAKNVEDTRLSRALNVDTTYKEGDAFNRDLQQQRKQERIDNRQRADDQRRLDYQRKQNLDTHHRTRSRSPVRRQPSRRRSPSRSPPPQRRLRSPSRSPQRWHRSPSRSLSPQRRRSYSRSSTPQRRRSTTRSPSPQRTDSRSTSPIAIRKSVSPQPAIIRAPPGPPPIRPPGL